MTPRTKRTSRSLIVALAFVLAWPGTVSAIHHEAAHVLVARHFGIETRWVGYTGSGAYTVLRPPSTGVTLRAWIWTLASGPISNAVVGIAVLAGWSTAGSSWFTAGGAFCMLVAAVELCTSFANAVPTPKSDGGAILDALRIARSPVVLSVELSTREHVRRAAPQDGCRYPVVMGSPTRTTRSGVHSLDIGCPGG